jgi:NADH-quinone oxidoreductase subunit M
MLNLQNFINVIKNFIFTAATAFTASITQLFQISRDIFLKERHSIFGNYTYHELILNIVLYTSLVILILFNTGNYDIYNTPMVVYNFSRLLYDPLIFILFMYLFKLKTFKSYLEYFEISYTDFLKVSLVFFMLWYGFYFIWLLDSQSNESTYHFLLTTYHHIGDQQYVLTSNNSLFHLPIGLEFYIDELSMLFMGLSFLLIFLCIVFLWPTLELDVNKTLYISQLFLLLTQLQATFTAANLLTFFVAFESLLIPMMIMIAIWGSKNNRQANNYLVFYTMFSAIPMLLAILYINNKTGTLNISELHELMLNQIIIWTWEEEMYLWLAFFLGFAVKTPMVPFHIWLPKAHVDAPTVGSVILAGLLLKVGLVGFIRVLLPLFPVATIFFSPYVSAVATVGVIYSSLITLRQIDMKRIIAYSSVAHMNMALVSLCSLNGVGIYSSIYLMLSHGLIASGLFFLVGFLYNRFHVRSIENYSGLGTIMPIMSMFFFIFTLANIAFPLTSGFIGEFLLLLGISLSNFYLGFLNAFSMLLTTVYSMLLFGRVFLGELNPWFQNLVENKYMMEKVTMEVQKNDKQEFSQDSTEDFNEYQHEILKSVSFFDIYYYEVNILIILLVGIFSMGIYPDFTFKFLVGSGYLTYMIDYTSDYLNLNNCSTLTLQSNTNLLAHSPLEQFTSLNISVFTDGPFFLLSTLFIIIFFCNYNTLVLWISSSFRRFSALIDAINRELIRLLYIHEVLARAYLPAAIITFFSVVLLFLIGDIPFNLLNLRGLILVTYALFLFLFVFINLMTVYNKQFGLFYCNLLRNSKLRMLGVGGGAAGGAESAAGGAEPPVLSIKIPGWAVQPPVGGASLPAWAVQPSAAGGLPPALVVHPVSWDVQFAARREELSAWDMRTLARRLLFRRDVPLQPEPIPGSVDPAGAGLQALAVYAPRRPAVYPRGSTFPELLEAGDALRPLTPGVHGPQVQGVPGPSFFNMYNTGLYKAFLKQNRVLFSDPVEEHNFQDFRRFLAAGNDPAAFRPGQYYYYSTRSDGERVRVYVIEKPRMIDGHPHLDIGVIQEAGGQRAIDPEFEPVAIIARGPCPAQHASNQLKRLVRPEDQVLQAGARQQHFVAEPGAAQESFWEWLQSFFW